MPGRAPRMGNGPGRPPLIHGSKSARAYCAGQCSKRTWTLALIVPIEAKEFPGKKFDKSVSLMLFQFSVQNVYDIHAGSPEQPVSSDVFGVSFRLSTIDLHGDDLCAIPEAIIDPKVVIRPIT